MKRKESEYYLFWICQVSSSHIRTQDIPEATQGEEKLAAAPTIKYASSTHMTMHMGELEMMDITAVYTS